MSVRARTRGPAMMSVVSSDGVETIVPVADMKQQFKPNEACAIEPKAFGGFFEMCESESESELDENGVAVVDIRGPLMHHTTWFFDSYDAIKSRLASALALNPRAVVLSIDSPGGLVSGAFDTARELREMACAANVELLAHIAGVGASAAYALASAASYIGVSETAMVGSIGVLDALVDATEQNAMFGMNVKLISSGQRKTDGHPDEPMTDGAIKATQSRVDELAEMFFSLVEEHGYGDEESLRALQANVYTGTQAVALGLASEVITFDRTLALASPGARLPSERDEEKGGNSMTTPMESAIEALQEAVDGDDEEEAKRAQLALDAMDMGDEEEEEGAEDGSEEEEEAGGGHDHGGGKKKEGEEEEAGGGHDHGGDKKEDEEKGKKATGNDARSIALRAMAKVHNLEARNRREENARTRASLIASRDDFSPDMVALLEDTSTPLKTVRKMVAKLDKGRPQPAKKTALSRASGATVTGTRGANRGDDRTPRLGARESNALKTAFGTVKTTATITHEPYRMVFGAGAVGSNETEGGS